MCIKPFISGPSTWYVLKKQGATLDFIITTYFTAGESRVARCAGGLRLHRAHREGMSGAPRIQGLGHQAQEHRGLQSGLRFIELFIPGPAAGDTPTRAPTVAPVKTMLPGTFSEGNGN